MIPVCVFYINTLIINDISVTLPVPSFVLTTKHGIPLFQAHFSHCLWLCGFYHQLQCLPTGSQCYYTLSIDTLTVLSVILLL